MKAIALTLGLTGLLLVGCTQNNRAGNNGKSAASQPSENQAASSKDATNTERNARDRDGTNPTADDQPENKQDIDVAAKVRRAVVGDKSLSTNAHNVKIITNEGTVTLRGPVDSEEEKEAVVAMAKEAAGEDHVVDELEVKSNR
jgi:hyperosmotically inducible protein